MAYCTTIDLAARLSSRKLIELCDDERTALTATTIAAAIVLNSEISARLTAAIADADATVDRWIRARYSVPLETTPQSIVLCSCQLAIYHLHARRSSEFDLPEAVANLRTDAMRYLQAVAKGDADIGIEPPPATSAKSIATTQTTTAKFTAALLGDF